MIKYTFILVVASALTGCTAVPVQQETKQSLFTFKKFNAPKNKNLEVETGEALFVEGSYIEGQEIKITEPIDMTIPGSMMVPFPIHIAPGVLKLARVDWSGRYFCAAEGRATASFPGLGSVIKGNDCVGIRVSLDGKYEWTVDNSVHNGSNTIWTRSMRDEDVPKYKAEKSNQPFKYQSLKRIVFNGYHGGQLHFTWEESTESSKDAKEFVFDFSGKSTPVGIKGNHFIVHNADNLKLIYEWQTFK